MNRLVSIIINCYNGEKYLKQCLDSVLNQTYKNWEIIFWDNQSNDKSKEIFCQYNDPRFKYFYSDIFTNLPEARNLAIKKAQGDYISFLDTDDFWEHAKLEEQVAVFTSKNVDFVYTNYFIKNKNQIKVAYDHKSHKNLVESLLENYHIGILTVVFKKEIIKKFIFNKNYKIISDFDLFINISKNFRVLGLDSILATYRLHDTNYTQKNFRRYCLELSIWYKKNYKELSKYKNIVKFKNLINYQFAKYLIKKGSKKSIIFFFKSNNKTKLKLIIFYLLN
jgi:glycosyltransferase involved in cell wall biosynthesis